ncbi:MAG: response regulator [Bacteroidetes bacterium]|nr:response regulator [Bacteroidota bacterium]
MKILIVEDEPMSAATLSKVLHKLGHEVVGHAASYDQAIKLAEEGNPELAFSDINLEGEKDGIEVANVMSLRFDIPVIFVTARTDADTINKAQSTEQYGYIVKPYRPDNIKASITLAIANHEKNKILSDNLTRYSAVIDALEDAVFIINKAGEIQFCNPNAEDITGWPVDENQGTPVNDVLEIEDGPGWDIIQSLPEAESIKLDETLSDNIFIINKSGNKVRVTGKLSVFEDKGIDGYVLTLRPDLEDDTPSRFNKIIKKEESFGDTDKYFFVREKNTLYRVLIEDIYWFESLGNYVKICTSKKTYVSHITMKEMMEIMPSSKFVRTHRSYIVNKDLISSIDYQELTVNDKKIPIGKTFREELIKNFVII